jgi:pimeloyl-ACP methyl ester carboxylesterase
MQDTPESATLPGVDRTASEPVIAYRRRAGAGDPVVLLHGVGSSSATWHRLVALLDPELDLVMPDYRGHGDSADGTPPYVLEDFTADVLRLTDEVGIDRFHLIGFSIGAVFAQALAASHQSRVASLTLLNSIADRTRAEAERALQRLGGIASSDPADIARESVARWFTPAFAAENPEVVAGEVGIVSANRPAPYASAYRILATTDLIDQASAISAPTLLVTGGDDQGSTPRMSRAIAERIRGSELVIVDGRKHYLHLEVPEVLAEHITDFLAHHPITHHE